MKNLLRLLIISIIVLLFSNCKVTSVSNGSGVTGRFILKSNLDIAGKITKVAIADNSAFLISESRSFYSIDISDPRYPNVNSYIRESGDNFSLNGGYAFVVSDEIMIVDIRDKTNIEKVVSDQGWQGEDIKSKGNYAYLISNDFGLKILNISDLNNISEHNSDPLVRGFEMEYRYPYLYCLGNDRFSIINISDPSDLDVVSTIEIDNAVTMDVADNKVYIVTSDKIQIYDITDRDFMRKTGEKSINYSATDIEVSGDYAFIGAGARGIYAYDIHFTNLIIEKDIYSTLGSVEDIELLNKTLYVANGIDGFLIVEFN